MLKYTIKKKVITRKSLAKKYPYLKKLGTEFRVKKDGKIVRTFRSRIKAKKYIKKKRDFTYERRINKFTGEYEIYKRKKK